MKLVRIEHVEKETCYDLSIRKHHNFFANGVCVHNTNSAIAIDAFGEMWVQSRNNIITPLSDNAGFAMYVEGKKDKYRQLLEQAASVKPITSNQVIAVFGEWCGGNIQKSVALTQLPKMFVVFAIVRATGDEREWFSVDEIKQVVEPVQGVDDLHHTFQFPHYKMTIDFESPSVAQNELVDLTIAVEQESPLAKQLGATPEKGSMIGEGIVWVCVTPGYEDSGTWFKVKGELHQAKSKVTTLKPVDLDKQARLDSLAAQVTPEWRLEQMLQETFNTLNGGTPGIEGTGAFIKAVLGDVAKEELDVIAASGFTMKEISGPVGKISRNFLLETLKF